MLVAVADENFLPYCRGILITNGLTSICVRATHMSKPR